MDEIASYYSLTRKAFDFLAPFYNVMTLPLIRVRNQVVDFTTAEAGSKILDVATGTGQQAFAFAERGCSVVGIDLTLSMLQIARKHNKNELVKFEIGDATQLPFEDCIFDVTCVSFALHDMPIPIQGKVLREMKRVTKLNGQMIIVDYDLPESGVRRALFLGFITLYEAEYYKQFVTANIHDLFKKTGIQIIDECMILYGAGRIYKGINL